MTLADAILADILDNPQDDFPRLVYADALEENAWRVAADGKARKGTTLAGDEADVHGESTVRARASFIRVQVELAGPDSCVEYCPCDPTGKMPNGAPCPCPPCTLRRRERDLLDALCRRGLEIGGGYTVALTAGYSTPEHPVWKLFPPGGGPEIANVEFRRGFVAEISLTCADFLTHAAALFAAAPIEKVTLTGKRPFQFYPVMQEAVGWFLGDDDDPYSLPADLFFLLFGGMEHGATADLPVRRLYVANGDDERYVIEDAVQANDAAIDDLSWACFRYGRAAAKGGA